jgi:hypothetical protein
MVVGYGDGPLVLALAFLALHSIPTFNLASCVVHGSWN